MKLIILIIAFLLASNIEAQSDETVTLVVSGRGKTQEEAKQNALRSAIEQAFGTFISSKTEILNDNLVKDEIISVSNGNIQKYDVISEVQTPDGNFATSINAIVSVTKLTSFAESKGVNIEFKGSLFGANMKQQKLNEEAEYKAVLNLCYTSDNILSKGLDYFVKANEPTNTDKDNYEIKLLVNSYPNSNFDNFKSYFINTIKGLSMSLEEIQNYKAINKSVYQMEYYDTGIFFEFDCEKCDKKSISTFVNKLNTDKIEYTKLSDKLYKLKSEIELKKILKNLGYKGFPPDILRQMDYLKSIGCREEDIQKSNAIIKDISYFKVLPESDTIDLYDFFGRGIKGKIKYSTYIPISFRNRNSAIAIQNLFLKSNKYIHDFLIIVNMGNINDTIQVQTCCSGSRNIYSLYESREEREEQKEYISKWNINIHNPNLTENDLIALSRIQLLGPFSYPDFSHGWGVYYNWVTRFYENNEFLSTKNYYTKTWDNYCQDGLGKVYFSKQIIPTVEYFNVINKDESEDLSKYSVIQIGNINFDKYNYYSSYTLKYNLEKISKISLITIGQR